MDRFNPAQKFSSIDRQGRYAYQNQPGIAQWNLTRLAEALLPQIDKDQEKAIELSKAELEKFPAIFETAHLEIFSKKIGLPENKNWDLVQSLLDLMAEQKADFTLVFRSLGRGEQPFLSNFNDDAPAREWLERWEAAGQADVSVMNRVNPAFIPRNHRVEEVIEDAKKGDFSTFMKLHRVLQQPYQEQPEFEYYQKTPTPDEVVCATFCGT